jgi:hypothetical protein
LSGKRYKDIKNRLIHETSIAKALPFKEMTVLDVPCGK